MHYVLLLFQFTDRWMDEVQTVYSSFTKPFAACQCVNSACLSQSWGEKATSCSNFNGDSCTLSLIQLHSKLFPNEALSDPPPESYLPGSFDLVVVVVRCQDDVFMDAIQQPQEEFQCIVLGIPTKLWSIPGHDSLEREKARRDGTVNFLQTLVDLMCLLNE